MIKKHGIVKDSASHISQAANKTCESLEKGLIEHEAHFTDRMLGRIEESVDGYEVKGINWRSRTFTNQKPGPRDKNYDAELLGVLEIKLDDYHIKKGFLAQAMIIEPEDSMERYEIRRMKDQLENMLSISSASFLFLYSKERISVVPAISVVNSKIDNPHELYSRSLTSFFMEHLESFIGDQKLFPSKMEQFNETTDDGISIRKCLYLSYGKRHDHENQTLDQFM
jgi:hypothetical protein